MPPMFSIQSVYVKSYCLKSVISYTAAVPKLWRQTIAAHREGVHQAILATTAALVRQHGLRSVTMSQIAEEAGIGRATLYKYFPDVESILLAWHQRHVDTHLHELAAAREGSGTAGERLAAVLGIYARIVRERGRQGAEWDALVHRGQHVVGAQQKVTAILCDVLTAAAAEGEVRADVPAIELANFCLHALSAASSAPSQDAVNRLVAVTLNGLRVQR